MRKSAWRPLAAVAVIPAAVVALTAVSRIAPHILPNPVVRMAWPANTPVEFRVAVRQAIADAGCDLEEGWA